MRKIEITEEEAKAIISQLENASIPWARVKNIAYFFEGKLKELDSKPVEEPEVKK